MIVRTVFRNPFRSAVSVLAAAIFAALILATISNMDSLEYLMRYEFEKMSHEDFTVTLRDPENARAARELRGLPDVTWAESQLVVVCDLSRGPREKRIPVTGLPLDPVLYTPLDRAGDPIRLPSAGLVLSDKLAEILHVAAGDVVSLRPLIGRRERVDAVVAGTVETYLGLSAYCSRQYLSRLLGENDVGNVLLGTADAHRVNASLTAALRERPTVVGLSERQRSFQQMEESFGDTMRASLSIMILFAGLIAFGSVVNTALVSLSERKREVGTLRVLGYSTRQVAGIFSGESLMLNAMGLAVGLAGGVGLARAVSLAYSTELYRFPAVIHPIRFIHTIMLMALFVGLAQLIVLWLIRKLEWNEALKVKE